MMSADLLSDLVKANLWAAAAILTVLLLRKPARRWFGASLAYGLWAVVPLAVIASFLPARRGPPIVVVTEAAFPASTDAPSAVVAPPFDYTPIILGLWAVGTALALGVLTWRQHRFSKALGRLRPDPIGGVVRAANPGVGPAVVGAIAPKIVIPSDFERRFTPEERAVVLAHEQVHLARQDARINALVALAQAVNWFNPLVHLAAFKLRIDQELACDAAVIARQPDRRRHYAEALLKTQDGALALPLGCCWPSRAPHPLKERIAMLKTTIPGPLRRTLGAGLLGTTALTIAAAAWASQPARSPEIVRLPASPAPASPSEPVGTIQVAQKAETPHPAARASDADAVETPRASIADTTGVEFTLLPQSEAQDSQGVDRLAQLTNTAPPPPLPIPAPAPSASPGPAPSVITRPDWLRMPSPQDVQRFYPDYALHTGASSGTVRLRCRVRDNGTLENCTAVNETPTDLGFAMQAMKMTPLFQMKAQTVDGASVGGAMVYVTIRFTAGDIPPAAASATPSVITRPDWLRMPTAQDVQSVYPDRALRMSKSGSARLLCRVREDGALEDCAVASETPADFGFGAAALRATPLFQMRSRTVDGAPVAGAAVYVTIRFTGGG